jgi:phosphoribosylformimino-5-aminoimidazole carboxamide ribotide isomerase
VKLYPAIDILDGRAVRLVKGAFDAKTVYQADPLDAARAWTQAGALRLHVVDLDGARSGAPVNLEHLRRIAGELDVPVQYGGGLRSADAVQRALDAGASRIVLGTGALTNPELLAQTLAEHGAERTVVSVDVRGGQVSIDGWTKAAGTPVADVFARLVQEGARELAYTDVDRDGMLEGIDTTAIAEVARAAGGAQLIYSGGIASLDDLRELARLRAERSLEGLAGVIVGKALYERRFTVAQAQSALGEHPAP